MNATAFGKWFAFWCGAAPIFSRYNKATLSRTNQSLLLLVILVVHLLLLVLVFSFGWSSKQTLTPVMRFVDVKEQVVQPAEVPSAPNIEVNDSHIHLDVPVVAPLYFQNDLVDYRLDLSEPQSTYSLPSRNSDKFNDVFDPRLRKSLQENYRVSKSTSLKKHDAWTNAHGQNFIETGDGNCLIEMHKFDSGDRARNWGITSCGKTDSEKMMDNVEQDLGARKHPLEELK